MTVAFVRYAALWISSYLVRMWRRWRAGVKARNPLLSELAASPLHLSTSTQSHMHAQSISEVFGTLWDFCGPVPSNAWKPPPPHPLHLAR